MFNSQSEDYRDLKIVFGNDKKIQKKDYFFHNANSAIRSSILKKYPFNEKVTNIEDRLWAKQILDSNQGLKIIYEPSGAVFHHHGLHQNNNKKRLKGVIQIMKNIENENLYPDEFLANNQKVYACIIGKKFNNISKKYIQNNKTLITKLDQNKSIEKIIIVVDKKYFSRYFNKKSKKFIFPKRNKYMKTLSIRKLLMCFYKKFIKVDIDYMMYFNFDYLERPKNFINELIDRALHGINNVVVYAFKIKKKNLIKNKKIIIIINKVMKNKKNLINSFNCLFGLGSIFYFNKLKNLSLKNKDIQLINLKNPKYLNRESKKININV